MIYLLFIAFFLPLLSVSDAAVVTWKCNQESDVKQYSVEYTKDAGASYEEVAIVAHPKPCEGRVTHTDALPIVPGKEMYRVFAIDSTDRKSVASVSAPAIPPPPVVVIGNIPKLDVTSITTSSSVITYQEPSDGLGGIAKSNIRYSIGDMSWGSAKDAPCSAGVCQLSDLPADSLISAMGLGFMPQVTGGSKFGPFSPIATFRTLAKPVPPPVPTVTLKQALLDGFADCRVNRRTTLACITLLEKALGKVTE